MPHRVFRLEIFSWPKSMMRAGAVWLGLAIMLAGAGCTPSDPMTAKISADDSTEFFRWQRDVASQLPSEAKKQFETTLAELRLDIQFRQEASGHDAIEAAVCQKLNHLSVKDALLLGAQLRWKRLAGEQADLQRVNNANSRLITKPGDQAAASDLEQYRAKTQQRLDAVTAEIATLEKEITVLGGNAAALKPNVPVTAPTAVSREVALQQVADMLSGRQTAAMVRDGGRPAKIDWEGRLLDETKRAEFLKQKAAAGKDRVVIPVRIRGRWLLFEGPDQAPVLPEDVRAQLTAAELVKFQRDWLEVEAELWARDVAKDLPDAAPAPSAGEK